MGLVIDPKAYIIGAAEIYYRAIGGQRAPGRASARPSTTSSSG